MMNRRWAEMTVSDRSDTRDDRSVAELVTQISDQTSHLVRDEMRLARAEMTETAKHAGVGLGLFGSAGMLAHFGLATLIVAGVAALALVLELWAAALIVAGALFVLAGIAALIGKGEARQATPTPERTVDSVKRDVDELKEVRHR